MKRNNKIVAALFLTFFFSLTLSAQPKGGTVSVTLDHRDWTYQVGQKARFSILIQRDGQAINNINTHIEIGPEKMPPTLVMDTVLYQGQLAIDGGTLRQPGFLRCTVTTIIDGKPYKAMATAAFSPERIIATAALPEDFSAFWTQTITDARKVPLDPRMKLLTERSTGSLNVYEVSIQSYRRGARIYGILCIPKKEGQYPVVLKVPGAGVRAYRGDTTLAEKGIITFEIGIHGIPVTLTNEVYYNLASGALFEYYFSNLFDKDQYYYKRVYAGCVRAVDYLLSLPQSDTSKVAVYGGSQGGALAIVTAALHSKVKYLAALYPALSDMTGYLHGRAGGWPHMFSPGEKSKYTRPSMIQTVSYYDVVNFARRVCIPGWYSWGYNDEVCPPTTSYAVYNSIKAPKHLFIIKDSGHWMTPSQEKEVMKWLLKVLKPNP